MTTKAEVFAVHQAHPDWHSVAIAQHLNCESAYVRATARRLGIVLPHKSRVGVKVRPPVEVREFSVEEIESLPGRQADLLASLADGLTYAEISAKHHIPIGTVKSRISRAREKLVNQRKSGAAA